MSKIVKIEIKTADHLVPWYLILSYLYYKRDISLISDTQYDNICKELIRYFHVLKHPHSKYISLDLLNAGTAFSIDDYPSIVIDSAESLLDKKVQLKIDIQKKTSSLEDFF